MEEKKLNIKITALDLEQFNDISEKLKTLPRNVLDQIEKAERHLGGILCIFKSSFKNPSQYYIPNNVKCISEHEDGNVSIILSNEFTFRILKSPYSEERSKHEYIILQS